MFDVDQAIATLAKQNFNRLREAPAENYGLYLEILSYFATTRYPMNVEQAKALCPVAHRFRHRRERFFFLLGRMTIEKKQEIWMHFARQIVPLKKGEAAQSPEALFILSDLAVNVPEGATQEAGEPVANHLFDLLRRQKEPNEPNPGLVSSAKIIRALLYGDKIDANLFFGDLLVQAQNPNRTQEQRKAAYSLMFDCLPERKTGNKPMLFKTFGQSLTTACLDEPNAATRQAASKALTQLINTYCCG